MMKCQQLVISSPLLAAKNSQTHRPHCQTCHGGDSRAPLVLPWVYGETHQAIEDPQNPTIRVR